MNLRPSGYEPDELPELLRPAVNNRNFTNPSDRSPRPTRVASVHQVGHPDGTAPVAGLFWRIPLGAPSETEGSSKFPSARSRIPSAELPGGHSHRVPFGTVRPSRLDSSPTRVHRAETVFAFTCSPM